MTDMMTETPSIRVHVTGTDVPDKRPEEYRVSHRTVNPTSNNPSQGAGYDPSRKEVRINVLVGPVVLCSNTSQANDAANQGATFTFPNGRVLAASQVEYVLPGPDEFWFASGVASAQVAFTLVRCI